MLRGNTGAVSAAVHQPDGVGFTVVLVLHVAAAVVAAIALVASEVAGARLAAARSRPVPTQVRTYFGPGGNWAGRALWLVPVFGGALLGMSGDYDVGDTWVLAGIGLWVAAIALAEGVLWPAERRAGRALDGAGDRRDAHRAARVVCWSAAAVFALLVAATAVMVGKP